MMKLDLDRFRFLKKEKGKAEGRRITNAVIEEETGINRASLDDYARFKDGIQNPISQKSLITLSRYFDCHPNYLNGRLKELAEDIYPFLKLSEEDYLKQHPYPIGHLGYVFLMSGVRYDDKKIHIPSFREYESKDKDDMNKQDFKQWLLAINMFGNVDFIESFPTNEEINHILSNMSEGAFEAFQAKMIECAEDYLVENGYYTPKNDYGDEDEIDRIYRSKTEQGFEIYRKRKEGK